MGDVTAADILARLRRRGHRVYLRNGCVVFSPQPAERMWKQLVAHRTAIIEALRAEMQADTPSPSAPAGPRRVEAEASAPAAPATQPAAPEKPAEATEPPEPVVYAGRHRITRADAMLAVRTLGDAALRDFETGVTSAEDAYAIAARRLHDSAGLRRASVRRR
jgi:hypothetical protein